MRKGTFTAVFSGKKHLAEDRCIPVEPDFCENRGLRWKGGGGCFKTRPVDLKRGWYTITWSLSQESADGGKSPSFQAELLDPDGRTITAMPLDEESEIIGYHTITVNLPEDQSYCVVIQAEHVFWDLIILQIPMGKRP
ncbi:hypothetical protein [Salinithrix halophila]|uniref:Uncharacterized protein n=1 Tax=Salinithrix halophila TaxID=1485204 RepID=A0ABV8JCX2_9BACL